MFRFQNLSLLLLLLIGVASAGSDELNIGISVNEYGDYPPEHQAQAFQFPDFPSDISIAFIALESGDQYAVLYSTLALRTFDRDASGSVQPLDHWSITRSPHDYLEPEVLSRYQVTGQERGDLIQYSGIGCYNNSPLRYGDIDSNEQNELVLFLRDDMVIFSPASQRVIFSTTLAVDDWLTPEESEDYYLRYGGLSENSPQYQSGIAASAAGNWQGGRFPGYRGYTKLYFDDFDEDGTKDIIAWRKLYESRLQNEDTQGFKLIRETFLHYNLVDGEYLPQETDPVAIESWLTVNELTWSDGYPRLSECPGEEGELIAEMHDPLLNDPDVLPQP